MRLGGAFEVHGEQRDADPYEDEHDESCEGHQSNLGRFVGAAAAAGRSFHFVDDAYVTSPTRERIVRRFRSGFPRSDPIVGRRWII